MTTVNTTSIKHKICSSCQVDKPHSDYYIRTGTNYPQARCKDCFKQNVSEKYVKKPTLFEMLTDKDILYVRKALLTHTPIKTMAKVVNLTAPTLSKYIKLGKFHEVILVKQETYPSPKTPVVRRRTTCLVPDVKLVVLSDGKSTTSETPSDTK